MEAYHYEMRPEDDVQDWFQHDGEDFVYVVSGSVVVEFEDGTTVELAARDSLHHEGVVAHRWRLRQPEPAEVLLTMAVPYRRSTGRDGSE